MAPRNRYIQNVPLNYVHLAAWVRDRGHAPHVLDMVFDDVTESFVDDYLRRHAIRVVGIGAMTCEMPQAVEQAKRLKSAHPGLTIVFGGAHPSGDPEECLMTGAVDYVIAGEGEIALTKLLDALEAGAEVPVIAGVWRMAGGKPEQNVPSEMPDVESLPRPAYDLLDLNKYFALDSPWHFPKSRNAVQMITSRGCPYQCSYCHTIHGKKFRGMSPAKVLDEIEYLYKTHGVRELMIVDDIFNLDLERAKAICRGIRDRGMRLHLQFPNGVRGDRFDEELVQEMKLAGTHFMSVAIETVSEGFQKLIRKNLKIDKSLETIHWAHKYRIEVSGFFMIGFPGETLDQVRETLDFAASAPLDAIFISIVAPFKGTVLRNDILNGRFGEVDEPGREALNELFPVIQNKGLTPAMLNRLRKETYWRFYTKPRSILNLAKKMTNTRNVNKLVRAVGRRVFERKSVSVN